MNMHRRTLLSWVVALALPWRALAQRLPREGVDYKPVTPTQSQASNTKVDVLEFFQYSCPHCYTFQAAILEWEKVKPADANYMRVPLSFDPRREIHVRIYYALQTLGLLDKLHQSVFAAIHKDRNPLLSEDAVADFMVKAGVSRDTWQKAINSKEVKEQAANARKLGDAYRVEGTPEMAVGGRFRTGPAMTGGNPALTMTTVNYLIGVVRKAQGRA
jgi:thiol:disulfide interchange protein DsbA